MEFRNKVVVTINTGNDSFNGRMGEREVARLLREAADKFETGIHQGKLFDFNGNAVGEFGMTS